MDDIDRQRLLARTFSRPVVETIARRGTAKAVARELRTLLEGQLDPHASVAEAFDACFSSLSRNYRCEYVYKAAIAQRIVFGRHSPRVAGLAVELPVGQSIVDVAVFNGTSTAYEIKTEFDSSRRLTTQTADYLRVFEKVYVVTHPALSARYAEVVDPRVGVFSLSARGRMTEVRAAMASTDRLCTQSMFLCLRRAEYMRVVDAYFGEQPELPNSKVQEHYLELFKQLPIAVAHNAFVAELKARCTEPSLVDFVTSLPESMRVLGYSTPLSAAARQRVLSAIATKVSTH